MKDASTIQLVIPARPKDLGGFEVHRVLPFAKYRMVGPFIFLDHMGPAEFSSKDGMNVRPHPHINLATVTYLFEGKIHHRDSLGSDQMIEPGAINWMTAGRGIVHSERTPKDLIQKSHRAHGIQLWVALPEALEECEPTFFHHPQETLPEFFINDVKIKLLLGKFFDRESPVETYSKLFYADVRMPKGSSLKVPAFNAEAAAYLVSGKLNIENLEIESLHMAVNEQGQDFTLVAAEESHVMLLGGESVGPRHIFWNFVSSSAERIEQAKLLWKDGPTLQNERFRPIPTDQNEFIPLP